MMERYLADRRTWDNLSATSCNHCLRALKGFCRWMVDERRASESPVARLGALNVQTDRRHERRALTIDEVRRLIGGGGRIRTGEWRICNPLP